MKIEVRADVRAVAQAAAAIIRGVEFRSPLCGTARNVQV